MDDRTARQEAIEAKKRRLEELRARRSNRAAQPSPSEEGSKNLDAYIDGLLKSKTPSVVVKVEEPTTANAVESSTTTNQDVIAKTTDSTESKPEQPVDTSSSSTTTATTTATAVVRSIPKETFAMGTQTEEDDFPASVKVEEDETKDESVEQQEEEEPKHTEGAVVGRMLSEEDVKDTLSSEHFSQFFVSASKKVERLLGEPVLADLLLDYSSPSLLDKDQPSQQQQQQQQLVTHHHVQLECPKWTHTRDCTDMEWSPHHRELLLASYHTPSTTSTTSSSNMVVSSLRPEKDTPSASLLPRSGELQSDGLALVWSLAMPNRPEHIFTCASPVLAGKFHPTEQPLVIGGCQSGQLVVWDIRAGRLPVQRSSLPTITSLHNKTHAHPIVSMEIMDSNSGLMTADSDGRLNFWSLSNLRDPAETFVIPNGNVSSLAVAPESNSIVCGDENGSFHTILAKQKQGKRAYKTSLDRHFGMITSCSTKPPSKQNSTRGVSKGFVRGGGGLVLTCGVDWTTKLWAPAYSDQPLLTLLSHSYDYMSDVQWSPCHPSVFATASSNGSLGIWNLATSLEDPLTNIVVDERGLNKIKWSRDGRRMAVACADKLHVLGLTEDVWKPKGDDESRMMTNLKSRGLLQNAD